MCCQRELENRFPMGISMGKSGWRNTIHFRRFWLALSLIIVIAPGLIRAQRQPVWKDQSPHISRFVRVNGIRLNFLDWGGHGKALLFLTGLGESPHLFDDIAPEFTDHFHVLSLERRGQGQSDKPSSGYDTDTLVEDIFQFLHLVRSKRVILVGFSMAGNELTRFAVVHPEITEKLIYLDAAYDYADPSFIHILDTYPVDLSRTAEDLRSLEALRDWYKRVWWPGMQWNDAMEAQLRDATSVGLDGHVKLLTTPEIETALFRGLIRYHPEYEKVEAPALSFYALWYVGAFLPPKTTSTQQSRVERWIERVGLPWQVQNVTLFRARMSKGNALEMRDTNHSCFLQKRQEVVRAMRLFLFSTPSIK